jgi:hypothetical protein
MRFLAIYSIAVLVLLALVTHFDAAGVFIYLGYSPAFLLAIGTIGVTLVAFGRRHRTRTQALATGVLSILLLGGVALITTIPTSPTKRFFLAYRSLVPGMAMADALTLMKPFCEPDRRLAPGTLTYRYRTDKSSVDVVHLYASTDGKQLKSAEFSPD